MTMTAATLAADPRTLLANPTLFRSWLTEQSERTIVGTGCQPEHCPLSQFLHDQGVHNPTVGKFDIEHQPPNGWTDIPYQVLLEEWAQALVRAVDLAYPWIGVTAEETLSLLDAVESHAAGAVLV